MPIPSSAIAASKRRQTLSIGREACRGDNAPARPPLLAASQLSFLQSRHIHKGRSRRGRGNRLSDLPEAVEVKRDGLSHCCFAVFASRTCRHATGQIGRVRRKACRSGFNDNQKFHLRPACFRMLLADCVNSLPPQDAAIGNPENPRRFRGCPSGKRPWMAFSTDSSGSRPRVLHWVCRAL